MWSVVAQRGMLDLQSREPGFESPLPISKFGHFLSLHDVTSDLAFVRNCCLARMLPREVELVPGGEM